MDIREVSVENLGLSNRSKNALFRNKIVNVGDLINCTEESLSNIKNLGKKSIKEILGKIEELKETELTDVSPYTESGLNKEIPEFKIPENFDEWLQEDEGKQYVSDWLKENTFKIDALIYLSARAYNILTFAGYEYLSEIAFMSYDELMQINRMDEDSANEIVKWINRYLNDNKEAIFDYINKKIIAENEPKPPTISEMIWMSEYHDKILEYVKENDVEVIKMDLKPLTENILISNKYFRLSDLMELSDDELKNFKKIGKGSRDDIRKK